MEIRKPEGSDNSLRIHIVTAYTLDDWGTVNKGKNLKFRYVLEQQVTREKDSLKTKSAIGAFVLLQKFRSGL